MKTKHWLVIFLALCCATSAFCSGSYNARPPRVPAGGSAEGGKIDNQKYALGKKIYTGKAKLPSAAGADRAVQEKRLRDLQTRLPAKVQSDVNLPELAGRLTAKELEALEYYVSHRYPSK